MSEFMRICGLNKTTLLDYPGHVAATVFTGGCNFRCPYCHNSDLVLAPGNIQEIPGQELEAFLTKRKGVLQGVCITGGEPTLQGDLAEFIRWVKGFGYLVKLDTNGYRPLVLEKLLQEQLLDYVAMDIKASKENYSLAVGMDVELEAIEESVRLLLGSKIPYEFRTTVVKGIHRIEEFEQIGQWLAGADAYYLQAYRENEKELMRVTGIERVFGTFSKTEMEQMQALARKYISMVGIRGLD